VTIQKKSLISKLNTTKKAIVASTPATGVSTSEVRASAARTLARDVARAGVRAQGRFGARAGGVRTLARDAARAGGRASGRR
jgi:hypothetical protein